MLHQTMPRHILRMYGTSRAFKAQKRRDLRALFKAFGDFRRGCAFVPGSHEPVREIEKALVRLYNGARVANWGR